MKTRSTLYRFFPLLMGVAALWLLPDVARGQVFVANSTSNTIKEFSSNGDPQGTFSTSSGPLGIALSSNILFVANSGTGTIGQYTTGGVELNASFVAALNGPQAVQVSGDSLYVLSYDDEGYGVIGKYSVSDGTPQNTALISQLDGPGTFAISDGYVYVTVTNSSGGSVSKFDINTGAEVLNLGNPFITGLDSPWGIAVSGSDLYVTNYNIGTIGKYTTAGVTTDSALISGLTHPWGVAVDGSILYVSNYGDEDNSIVGTIGQYTTSGGTLNAALVSTLSGPTGIAVIPEPAAWVLLAPALAGLILLRSRRREIASK